MKKFLLIVFLNLAVYPVAAQDILTLSAAYEKAMAVHPVSEQGPLLRAASDAARSAVLAKYLPQFQIVGQATYQNEVTQLEIPLPGIDVPSLPLEQFRAVLELNQVVYDGGAIRTQTTLQEAGYNTRLAQSEVDLHSLRERVRDVYFGALIAVAQVDFTNSLARSIRARLQQVEAAVRNGVGLPSASDVLKAELLKIEQQVAEARLSRDRLLAQLSILTGIEIDENTELEKPDIGNLPAGDYDNRSERRIFESGREAARMKARVLTARQLPRVSLFAQGGAGRPGLNFLKDEVRPIGMVGVRLQWSIWDFGSTRNERTAARLEADIVDTRERAFDQTLALQRAGLNQEMATYDSLLMTDRSIVELREKIAETSSKQFELGVTTPTQLVEDMNAVNQARLSQVIHELLFLKAKESIRQMAGL